MLKKINIENWYIVYAIGLSKTILQLQWKSVKSVCVDVFLLVVDRHSVIFSSINMINYVKYLKIKEIDNFKSKFKANE
jgi:hypothetical protein